VKTGVQSSAERVLARLPVVNRKPDDGLPSKLLAFGGSRVVDDEVVGLGAGERRVVAP
jgi:hypothetical protein